MNLKNLCKHAASKLFDEIDILSEKMSCFTDNILAVTTYWDTFYLFTYNWLGMNVYSFVSR